MMLVEEDFEKAAEFLLQASLWIPDLDHGANIHEERYRLVKASMERTAKSSTCAKVGEA